MADKHHYQPSHDPILNNLENRLESWRDQLAEVEKELTPHEMKRLEKRWLLARQKYDAILIAKEGKSPDTEALMSALPPFDDLNLGDIELMTDVLQKTKSNLLAMSTETKNRASLLEDSIATEKPEKLRKNIEKLRTIEAVLRTRLIGLDAYIELFDSANLDECAPLESTKLIMQEAKHLSRLNLENQRLDNQIKEMNHWLSEAEKELSRRPLVAPPSPDAMREVGQALMENNEIGQAILNLFTNHERIKNARSYIEAYLAPLEEKS